MITRVQHACEQKTLILTGQKCRRPSLDNEKIDRIEAFVRSSRKIWRVSNIGLVMGQLLQCEVRQFKTINFILVLKTTFILLLRIGYHETLI